MFEHYYMHIQHNLMRKHKIIFAWILFFCYENLKIQVKMKLLHFNLNWWCFRDQKSKKMAMYMRNSLTKVFYNFQVYKGENKRILKKAQQ